MVARAWPGDVRRSAGHGTGRANREESITPAYGFLAEFEARPGKEKAVAQILVDGRALVDEEPGTLTRYSFRLGPGSFRIFDAFETEEAQEAHIQGKVREAIAARADELFGSPPVITPVDVLAAKMP